MNQYDSLQWKLVSSKKIYENNFITVFDEIVIPGNNSASRTYGRIHFKKQAAGVVVLRGKSKQTEVLLIGQWRYPLDHFSWEIPEGGGKRPCRFLDIARRELAEETGYLCNKFQELCTTHTSNSVTDEEARIFLCWLEDCSTVEVNKDDCEEFIYRWVSLQEAIEMIAAGTLTDSLSQVGVLLAARLVN